MKKIVITLLVGLSMPGCISTPKRLSHNHHRIFETVTITSITELEPYVDDDTLVLFDLDHTVFEAAHVYGHANWFYGQINEGKRKGIGEEETVKRIFPAWLTSQEHSQVKPVEPVTPALIKRLQQRRVTVMGLTARQTPLIAATLRQLAQIDVDFSKTSLKPAVFGDREFAAPVAFRNGIIFTSEFVKKSEVLKAYLDRIGYKPRRIVFVDDSKRHVDDLTLVFSGMGISVIGLHYPYVQARNTPWDQRRANLIFEQCNKGTQHKACQLGIVSSSN